VARPHPKTDSWEKEYAQLKSKGGNGGGQGRQKKEKKDVDDKMRVIIWLKGRGGGGKRHA